MTKAIQLQGPFASNKDILNLQAGETISHLAILAPYNHKIKITQLGNIEQEITIGKYELLDYEVDSIIKLDFSQKEGSSTIVTYILEKEEDLNATNN